MKWVFAVLVGLTAQVWAAAALAQGIFVQIEAHSNLNDAQVGARDFATQLPDVNAFQMSGGWYAIALGPYTESDAIARMESLKANRRIPADSYLAEFRAYTRQYYPVGVSVLGNAPVPAQQSDETAAAQDTGETQPVVAPEPPQETRRDALRSESRLTRQGKFNLQIALQWFGYYDGAIDAAFGPGTRNSMAAWQEANNFEPTGVLTTRQRDLLTGSYEAVLDSLGLAPLRDNVAGIEMDLPQAMVAFDRYDPPFAHYKSINDSGVKVLLISQTGDENTLLGLFDIMQTLEIVPLEGERSRSSGRFTLQGANAEISSYTYAELSDGAVKGFTLIWPVGDEARRNVALKAMRDSFSPIDGAVLPDTYGDGALDQSLDLISGLQIRRPDSAASGFYIDNQGAVLTTASAINSCARVTLDETYEAQVVASDTDLDLALLRPTEALAPLDYARFQPGTPRLKSEVAVSGYSFMGMLGAPTLTFGTLADLRGLNGEDGVTRLALAASVGDAGGPVFDTSGSVLGMLMTTEDPAGKRLPDDVSFAADAVSIATFLSNSGLSPSASEGGSSMSAEDLTKLGANLTVLVSCWGE